MTHFVAKNIKHLYFHTDKPTTQLKGRGGLPKGRGGLPKGRRGLPKQIKIKVDNNNNNNNNVILAKADTGNVHKEQIGLAR
jgi:hypothetical protein